MFAIFKRLPRVRCEHVGDLASRNVQQSQPSSPSQVVKKQSVSDDQSPPSKVQEQSVHVQQDSTDFQDNKVNSPEQHEDLHILVSDVADKSHQPNGDDVSLIKAMV